MKIAIQVNPSRGKEIISLLESLGGINERDWKGDGDVGAYYIDENNIIRYDYKSIDYKVYTLEEFEKAFPFKIGDEVTIVGIPDFPKIITQIIWDCDEILYSFEGLNNTWFGAKSLKKFEMKEERNITLTLEKAKEWYKKGGELKEIALQAFSEKELTKVELPKTWEEFCENYPVQVRECWLENCDMIREKEFSHKEKRIYKNWIPSKESAESHLAMIQLEQLRNCWWGDWEPNWNDEKQTKYCIVYYKGEFKISILYETRHFLSFPTIKMAEEFLKYFRDLIEKAGDLI